MQRGGGSKKQRISRISEEFHVAGGQCLSWSIEREDKMGQSGEEYKTFFFFIMIRSLGFTEGQGMGY